MPTKGKLHSLANARNCNKLMQKKITELDGPHFGENTLWPIATNYVHCTLFHDGTATDIVATQTETGTANQPGGAVDFIICRWITSVI